MSSLRTDFAVFSPAVSSLEVDVAEGVTSVSTA